MAVDKFIPLRDEGIGAFLIGSDAGKDIMHIGVVVMRILQACRTFSAAVATLAVHAIEIADKGSGYAHLPNAFLSAKKDGMGQTVRVDKIAEGSYCGSMACNVCEFHCFFKCRPLRERDIHRKFTKKKGLNQIFFVSLQ